MVTLYSEGGNSSSEVTTADNTANVPTEIFTVTPTSGTALVFKNNGPTGGSTPGIPIALKLRQDGGTDMPVSTKVWLAYRDETMDSSEPPTRISEIKENINFFVQQSISDQRNKDYVDDSKFELKANNWVVTDEQELLIMVESSSVVDHDDGETEVYIDEQYVEQRPMDR